jgi:hypothetical protein
MSFSLSLKYLYDEQYDPVFVNGAIGQRNDTGEAIIHFFAERNPLPRKVKLQYADPTDEDSLPKLKVSPKDLESSRLRVVKAGIVMNIEQLKELHSLLGKLINETTV